MRILQSYYCKTTDDGDSGVICESELLRICVNIVTVTLVNYEGLEVMSKINKLPILPSSGLQMSNSEDIETEGMPCLEKKPTDPLPLLAYI